MIKRIICIALSAFIMLTLFGCSANTKKERFSQTIYDAFDTVTTVIAYDTDQKSFEEHIKDFESRLKKYDRLFDIYHSYGGIANLCTINEKAKDGPVQTEEEIIRFLEYAKNTDERLSEVNICFGSVLSLWHEARERALENPEEAKLPDRETLKEAANHTDINDLIIDSENSTVAFADKKLKLDVGALAKGYSAKRLQEEIRDNGIWENYAISIGGNVITSGYKNSDGASKWNIEIENPDRTSEAALETLSLTELSVVTSGDYQRYFTVDGKNYCHIIDPETLMPAENFSGVTVISADSAQADLFSTALFLLPLDEGRKIVEETEGVEAVWVDKNFHKTYSSGFEKYIKK